MSATATASHPARTSRRRKPVAFAVYDEFTAAVRAVALAASKDPHLEILQCVHVSSDGANIDLVASDSYRVHRAVVSDLALHRFDCLISAAWLAKALRDMTSRVEHPTLLVADGLATVATQIETRSIKLYDGPDRYPDTDEIFAKASEDHDPDVEVAVNPRYFADVLKACDMFGNYSPARFKVPDGRRPTRFEVLTDSVQFTGLIMPIRITS